LRKDKIERLKLRNDLVFRLRSLIMIYKKLKYAVFFTILILLFSFAGFLSVPYKMIPAENGTLNLDGQDFSERGTFKLDGQWAFYWNKLLDYSNIQHEEPDLYANVPDTWNKYECSGENLPGQGCATYRLHIITGLDTGTRLGLRMNTLSSAYRLYVNEELIASAGQATDNAQGEIGQYKPQTVSFQAPSGEFDIIVQVSNFEYARGGLWNSIYLGSAENISAYHTFATGKELFLIGVFMIVFLFHLSVYLQTGLKSFLYSSCFCLFTAVMIDTVGENIIIGSIVGLPLKTAIFIWYTSTNLVPLFLLVFMNELFKTEFSKFTVKIYFLITAAFQLAFILLTASKYTELSVACDLHNIAGFICVFFFIAAGMRKGYQDGWLHLLSMVIVLGCYIHDTLYYGNIIHDHIGEIFYAGLFLYVYIQMIMQSKQLKESMNKNAAMEMAFLQAQIKPHFLYNALNTVVSISRYDAPQARSLLINFSNYLRRSFDFKDLSQFTPLKNEIEIVRAYVDIGKAQFEERLEVSFDICDNLEVNVPVLMLQPVVENAMFHGVLPKIEGGRVEISVNRNGRMLVFTVKDNGVGMEQEKLKSLLRHESASGVGLLNINDRLKRLYGKGLQIKSCPGTGTEVTWTVQINK